MSWAELSGERFVAKKLAEAVGDPSVRPDRPPDCSQSPINPKPSYHPTPHPLSSASHN